jgi:NADPH:quinone reductase and related Zn-dependent oxidoreductases
MLAELDKPFLADMSSELFKTIHQLLTSLEGLLWVVRAASGKVGTPNSSMVKGFARSIRSETNIKFAMLDLDSERRPPDDGAVSSILTVFKSLFMPGCTTNDFEYRERDGQLLVPRVDSDSGMDRFIHRETSGKTTLDLQPFSQPGRPLKIKVGTPGALDTLHFIDDTAVGTDLAPQEVEIEVKATSMNFKDIMISMGQLSSEYLGIECSGIVSRIGTDVVGTAVGDRVCASTEGAYSTFARCKYTSVSLIPDQMTFEEAATIPIAFCTAYYSLFDLGRLTEGETVLVHAAAGGVGQAAIMLAKHAGAEIYATVGSESKKSLIMERYGVPQDHIFYSRDTSFGPAIRRATQGRGIDVILNSLAGDLLRETWDCISHFGRFVEIGKRDIVGNSRLEMRQFDYNATFSSVDLTVLAAEKPKLMKRLLDDVFKLFYQDTVKPIAPINVYTMSEVEMAFRLLQSGKATGKLVIVPGKDDQVKVSFYIPHSFGCLLTCFQATTFKTPDDLLRHDATYVIIGGTGGLGRSISRWMISKGARHIVLLSRRGSSSGKVHELN